MGRASNRKKARRAAEDHFGSRRIDTPHGRRIEFDTTKPAGAELEVALRTQLAAFTAKFGRPPEGDDPIFFDPDADEPRPLNPLHFEADLIPAMQQAGFDPAYIYACQMTELIPTEMNRHLLTDDDLAEFGAAMDRYNALHSRPGD